MKPFADCIVQTESINEFLDLYLFVNGELGISLANGIPVGIEKSSPFLKGYDTLWNWVIPLSNLSKLPYGTPNIETIPDYKSYTVYKFQDVENYELQFRALIQEHVRISENKKKGWFLISTFKDENSIENDVYAKEIHQVGVIIQTVRYTIDSCIATIFINNVKIVPTVIPETNEETYELQIIRATH